VTARRDTLVAHSTARARFWTKVKKGGMDECWPWMSKHDHDGYGRVYFEGKIRSTHRIAFTLATGNPATGLPVCHRCDNPPCCNPNHLFLGTHQINMADRDAKGRTASGERNGRAKLTWKIVGQIRAAFKPLRVTIPKLSATFGVNRHVVADIIHGKTWKVPSSSTSTERAA
jgi:hypothetical protein